jgi:SAM-dependent methyltransferase
MNPEAVHQDDERNISFFSELVRTNQISPFSLNWGSRASQEMRFAVLEEVGDLAGASLLDVGCGLGDFYDWQRRAGLGVSYQGVDLTPEMIRVAKERFPGVDFRVGNVLEEEIGTFDYVIASGTFYLRQNEPFEFMQYLIARLFASSRKGLAFNSLSAWCDGRDAGEFYADPAQTLDFCRTLTPWVALRHDYYPRDFTVYLRHAPRRP